MAAGQVYNVRQPSYFDSIPAGGYMYQPQSTVRAVEVEQLTQTWQFDGVDVTVRCFYVIAPRPRYELLMSGWGSAGVVDVPVDREDNLPAQMEEAAVCFATALRLRQIVAS